MTRNRIGEPKIRTDIPIGKGCPIRLHVSLTLPDGTIALDTFPEAPLALTVGDGTLSPGLESLILGLRAGDERRYDIAGEAAFGPPDPARMHRIPRSSFPDDMQLTEGSVIGFTLPGGEEVAGTLRELGDENALVDFNHPLGDLWLGCRVRILEVLPRPKPASKFHDGARAK